MKYIRLVNDLITTYFAAWIIIISVIAFLHPGIFSGMKPLIVPALGVVMLGMGMTLEFSDFKRIFNRPRDVTVGIVCQYLFMPFIGFILASLFMTNPLVATGVVLVGSCPGGTASNVITYLSKGDLALSVTMTMVSTLISPLLIPLSMYVYANRWIDVPAANLFISSFEIVVIPVAAGILLGRIMSRKKRFITPFLPTVSSLGIILIVAVIVALNAGTLLSVGLRIVLVVILHNLLGLSLGYTAASAMGMNSSKARAIAIEVGMQNSGLGVVLASANFGPLSALPSAIFSIWHNISGSILAFFWSRKPIGSE